MLCRRIGFDCKEGESHLDALLRGELFATLAVFGHEETLIEANKRFQAFLEDRNTHLLPPDIRRVRFSPSPRPFFFCSKKGKFVKTHDLTGGCF